LADLTTDFAGIRCPNPFWLASAPPTNCGEQIMRAFDAGWGGAVWKTIGEPITNVSSRYSSVDWAGQRMMGLNNIELISDRPIAVNLREIEEVAASDGSGVVGFCGKVESELAGLSEDEAKEFCAELGIGRGGLDKLIVSTYELLGLMTFLTAGEKEVRAWTIERGTKAPQAAGKIHSDIERGFIRAEIVSYADYVKHNTMDALRTAGLVRQEGKDYVMQEGDVVNFKFNV